MRLYNKNIFLHLSEYRIKRFFIRLLQRAFNKTEQTIQFIEIPQRTHDNIRFVDLFQTHKTCPPISSPGVIVTHTMYYNPFVVYHKYMYTAILFIILITALISVLAGLFIFSSLLLSLVWGSPYMGVQKNIIRQILAFGGLSKDDVFYDLGAGDARIVIVAKKYFDAQKVTGYEISPWPYIKGRAMIRGAALIDAVKFERKNIFGSDFSDATFVYMYLYTSFINEKIAPKLARELKAGTKILSCSSRIDLARYPMFEPLKTGLIGNIHVYLYRKM